MSNSNLHRSELKELVREILVKRTDLSYDKVGAMFGVSRGFVWLVSREAGLCRRSGPKSSNANVTEKESC